MGTIHKFKGEKGKFSWDNVSIEPHDPSSNDKGVTKRVLISQKEGAPYFAIRYFEIEPGGWSSSHRHPHDHGVIILKGKGEVLLGDEKTEIGFGDAIYIPPNEMHRFKNIGEEILGFICVIYNAELIH